MCKHRLCHLCGLCTVVHWNWRRLGHVFQTGSRLHRLLPVNRMSTACVFRQPTHEAFAKHVTSRWRTQRTHTLRHTAQSSIQQRARVVTGPPRKRTWPVDITTRPTTRHPFLSLPGMRARSAVRRHAAAKFAAILHCLLRLRLVRVLGGHDLLALAFGDCVVIRASKILRVDGTLHGCHP